MIAFLILYVSIFYLFLSSLLFLLRFLFIPEIFDILPDHKQDQNCAYISVQNVDDIYKYSEWKE